MSERQSIHDGWTPEPQEEVQPGDPLTPPVDAQPVEPLTTAEKIADALEAIGVHWPDYPGGQFVGAQRERAVRAIAATLDAARAGDGLSNALIIEVVTALRVAGHNVDGRVDGAMENALSKAIDTALSTKRVLAALRDG